MSAKKGGFDRFIQTKESGAKLKEKIRQEKKKAREEKNAFFEQKKLEKAQQRAQKSAAYRNAAENFDKPNSTRDNKPYKKTSSRFNDDKRERPYKVERSEKPSRFSKTDGRGERSSFKSDRSERPSHFNKADGRGERSSYKRDDNKRGSFNDDRKASGARVGKSRVNKDDERGYKGKTNRFEKSYDDRKKEFSRERSYDAKSKDSIVEAPVLKAKPINEPIPLNKFLAHAGVSSRRDAAEIVKEGKVSVNGQIITEPGFKVTEKDEIKFNGKKLFARKNLVYILLNKPKDYITTTEDPQGRKTVLDIVKNATDERIYPIGRLDRNTTGVLLLTNDGELAQKLSHPSYEVRKIYEVKLDKDVTKADFDKLAAGVTLEDGFIQPDAVGYPDPKDKSVIGIEIHSGKNRIVRRIFEHLGYDVRNLDRVMYADLTKKNVDRGKWRFLSEKEVRILKFLNKSYAKNKKDRG